ncbi:poly(A) polymerase-like [Drosophila kikkawai]|uniref:Poly(A) polymerase-like n=1 Tax=Drosophila kikkawai TaxID=30033 RepID=A0ABM4GHM4_DROKI
MVPSLLRISSTPPSSPSRIFIEDGGAISTSTLETTLINGGNDDDDDDDDVATTTTTNKPAPSPILNEDREVDTTLISEGDGTTTTTTTTTTTNKPAPSPIFNDDDNDDGTTTTTTNKPAPSPILFENGEEQSMRTLEPILPSTTGNESNTTLVMTRERLLLNSSTFEAETSTSAVTSTSTTTANTMADDSSSFKILLGIPDNDEDNQTRSVELSPAISPKGREIHRRSIQVPKDTRVPKEPSADGHVSSPNDNSG